MPEIHIEIRCDSDGFPSPDELALRDALEDALHESEAGEVVDSGGGRGVMDIYLDVADADAAIATATTIIERLGIEGRTKVERMP